MHPVITIFCAFTRRWAVDQWLENLAKTTHAPNLTNLCIIVDCDEPYIANTARKFAENKGYRSFHVKVNEHWQPNEVRLAIRRQRVADVHNQSKDLISLTDGEYIVGLEDDTIFDRDPNWLMRLLEPFTDSNVAFVEGVQMGRWGANMIGAWLADDPHSPTIVQTLLPPPEGEVATPNDYQEITGGGWYGYVTRRFLYLNCEYYTSSAQPWGPDVNYGFWLSQQGFKCLIDWNTIFGHKDYSKTLYPDSPEVKLAQIVYNKDRTTGKWNRTDHEPSRY